MLQVNCDDPESPSCDTTQSMEVFYTIKAEDIPTDPSAKIPNLVVVIDVHTVIEEGNMWVWLGSGMGDDYLNL